MSQRMASLSLILGLALTVAACNTVGSGPAGTAATQNSLYDRLGANRPIGANRGA